MGLKNLPPAPPTEGVKYIGSKLKLLPFILYLAEKTGARRVLDGFSGTTRVSQALARCGYEVLSNDRAVWSEIFGTCYLLNQKEREAYRALIDHLNACPPRDGWFTHLYGGNPAPEHETGGGVDGKKPWQVHVTRKLDAIREEIERMGLETVEKAVALTSLMLALDRVDNTLGHFASYLKGWSARSWHPLVLEVPRLAPSRLRHRVFRADIFDLLPHIEADLAYLDPPYGSGNDRMPPSRVRYAAYYHLWTTVCQFDRPEVFGKANRRRDTSDVVAGSVFEDYRKGPDGKYVSVTAIDRLIREVRTPWVLLSYSSGGQATAVELADVLSGHGEVREILQIDYRRHRMAHLTSTREWVTAAGTPHHEFLFLLRKPIRQGIRPERYLP